MVQKSESAEELSQIVEPVKGRECVFRVETHQLKFLTRALQGATSVLHTSTEFMWLIACNDFDSHKMLHL